MAPCFIYVHHYRSVSNASAAVLQEKQETLLFLCDVPQSHMEFRRHQLRFTLEITIRFM